MHLDTNDYALIRLSVVELSASSLDRSPKKNWVEKAGQLPPYVRKLAREIEKSGHELSSAIAIALSRVKDWSAGGDGVDADTVAKSAKAVAQWEALKAKNADNKVVKLSHENGGEYLMLSNVSSFNTEVVRRSWDVRVRAARDAARAANPGTTRDAYDLVPYSWIRELWTDFIVVEQEASGAPTFLKIPYTVSATNGVVFGAEQPVELAWKDSKGSLTRTEKDLLKDILIQK